jgi:ribose/xylose/arabinose/galactoside ABC-type transport system permease subunit
VPSFWQQVAIGVVIIAVVAFDVFRRRIAAQV